MVKLSICIPNYNRPDLLREALESILPQASEEVEIAICDNGSQEDVTSVVHEYQSRFPRLTYFQFTENQGVDRCFIQSIAMAQGEYCWLMGNDDKIEPGAVQKILNSLHADPYLTGISVNLSSYDYFFKKKIKTRRVCAFNQDTLLQSLEEFFPHFYIYSGFLSGQVVNRALWMEIVKTYPVENFFNCYVLVYIIMHMMEKRPRWLYIHQECVAYRADNDSFLDRGAYRRLEIDIVGFGEILAQLFPVTHPIYKRTMSFMGKIDVSWRLFKASVGKAEKHFWKKSFALCWTHFRGYPVFWYRLIFFFFVPSFAWKTLRFIYRNTFKKIDLNEKNYLSAK